MCDQGGLKGGRGGEREEREREREEVRSRLSRWCRITRTQFTRRLFGVTLLKSEPYDKKKL